MILAVWTTLTLATDVGITNEVQVYQAAIDRPYDEPAFSAFLAKLPKISDGRYVVEGDMLLGEKEIRDYLVSKKPSAVPADNNELIINLYQGGLDYWADRSERKLTYAVDRHSFRSQDQYDHIVADLSQATKDWVNACPECGISFSHLQQFDDRPSFEHVLFIVRLFDSRGVFVAASFFPHDAPDLRFLNIDPSYFSPSLGFSPVGVLRHELGHILGYLHEHIRQIAGCNLEGTLWKPLTPYDPHSVMHYFCGGGGTIALELTKYDRDGHRALYMRSITRSSGVDARKGAFVALPQDSRLATIDLYEAAIDRPYDEPAFSAFLAKLPKISDGRYVVEGDMLLGEKEIRDYLVSKKPSASRGPLTAGILGGRMYLSRTLYELPCSVLVPREPELFCTSALHDGICSANVLGQR
jgi:hypothetical protein